MRGSSSAACGAVASVQASAPSNRSAIRPEVNTVSVRAHSTARAGLGDTSTTAMPSSANVITSSWTCWTSAGARPLGRLVEEQHARRAVEHCHAWITHARQHARDYERLVQPSESLITWAATTL